MARRRFQFRLRSLFVVMTILAVQCAVCFPAVKEWEKQEQVKKIAQSTSCYICYTLVKPVDICKAREMGYSVCKPIKQLQR
jgi:hypothetical protein